MHTHKRITLLLGLSLVLVPLFTTATIGSVTIQDKRRAKQELSEILSSAKATYVTRLNHAAAVSRNKKIAEEAKKKLLTLGKEKRAVRLKLLSLHRKMQGKHNDAAALVLEESRTRQLLSEELDRFTGFVHLLQARRLVVVSSGPRIGDGLVRRMLRGSLGDRVAVDLRDRALVAAREQLVWDLRQSEDTSALTFERLSAVTGDLALELRTLETEHRSMQKEYLATLRTLDHAENPASSGAGKTEEIQKIVADVHAQVLALQSELARIDAKLRAKAERDLIEKGLRAPRPGSHSDGTIVGGPEFVWPIYGPISAGFHDESYKKYFGVPHQAIDIVAPQGSRVSSAADGIVFVVRDGGTSGYTYVLIGHRDGFATLSGHLSSVSVIPGQTVRKGQAIGLSGGTPGTSGAGPMTTGAHLHFEMIQQGTHIDPREVLP